MEQKNCVAATTQDVPHPPLNSFGDFDIPAIMADYTAESRFFTPKRPVARLRGDSEILREVVRGVREAGNVLRDARAGGRRRYRLHRVEGRDGGQPLRARLRSSSCRTERS